MSALIVSMLLAIGANALRVAPTTLNLDTVFEYTMNTIDSPQFTYTVSDSTITNGLASSSHVSNGILDNRFLGVYFYAFPCRGRFDLYLNKNAQATKTAQLAQLVWKDGTDSTFKYLSVATAPLDTVFYVALHAYDLLANGTDFATVRLVVTRDKEWPTKNIVQLADSKLTGEVVDDESTLRVTFKPAAPRTGFVDSYEVFTRTGSVGDPVKEPLNGCSLPTLLDRLDPQPAIKDAEDATLRTFSVNNTHKVSSDPAFTAAVRVCRQPGEGTGYTWCVAYQTLSVCDGTSCEGTRGAAPPTPRAAAPLAALCAALLWLIAANHY